MTNVIFDLDGTLLDSRPGIESGFQLVLKSLELPEISSEQMRKAIGPGLHAALSSILPEGRSHDLENAVKQFRKFYDSEGYKEYSLYEGIDLLLKRLKESGRRLFVVSMKSHSIVEVMLQHSDLLKYFEESLGSDPKGGTAEKHQLLEAIINKWQLRREETTLVGDTKLDFEAALKSRVSFVGVTYGYGSTEDFPVEIRSQLRTDTRGIAEALFDT